MKNTLSILLLICFTMPFCRGQFKVSKTKANVEYPTTYRSPKIPATTKGTIKPNNINPKAGIENTYTYAAPTNLLIPKNLQAQILYMRNGVFHYRSVAVEKKGNVYQFHFKAPDSVAVLTMGMVDGDKIGDDQGGLVLATKEIVDNNNEATFTVYLHDPKNNSFDFEKLSQAILLLDQASYYLSVKRNYPYILSLFEEAYKLHPKLKKEDSYSKYLYVINKVKGNEAKPKLMDYAMECLAQQNEKKWQEAAHIYELLKMDEEAKSIKDKIIPLFPDGKLAEEKYWEGRRVSYNKIDTTEEAVLASMDKYSKRFKNSSASKKDDFYWEIIGLALNKTDWMTYRKYMLLLSDVGRTGYIYNYYAKKFSGNQLNDTATDLKLAKWFSQNAMEAAKAKLAKMTTSDDFYEEYQSAYLRYANTYAAILYKSGQYDSAFYYQDMIYRLGSHYEIERLVNYAVYAERSKGLVFAKNFIEENLLKGIKSPAMSSQLQNIYKKLNLPDDEFNRVNDYNTLAFKKKYNAIIAKKYGTIKARDFALRNMKEATVALSSLVNKVVVIDFWATWCVPCRESFPAMKKLMNKYKEDSSVVFLFVDVWEDKPFQKMKEAAAQIMKDGGYNFNVLLDEQNKAVAAYKISAIPAKFVIDRKGNLLYMGEEISDVSLVIEAAKSK